MAAPRLSPAERQQVLDAIDPVERLRLVATKVDAMPEREKRAGEIDWERYLENHSSQTPDAASGVQEDIVTERVKQAVKQLIDGEDRQKPFSDQTIVELLVQQKIVVSRRTVAKYREMLGIPNSAKRKKYF